MTGPSIETAGNDSAYMRQALVAAQEAFTKGEVPVGAIIVQEGQIIAAGFTDDISGGPGTSASSGGSGAV